MSTCTAPRVCSSYHLAAAYKIPQAWTPGESTRTRPLWDIVNVAPSTNLVGFGYISPFTPALVQRLFYQTTNGNLVTAVHTGTPNSLSESVDITPNRHQFSIGDHHCRVLVQFHYRGVFLDPCIYFQALTITYWF
jgi:hypothetical protein